MKQLNKKAPYFLRVSSVMVMVVLMVLVTTADATPTVNLTQQTAMDFNTTEVAGGATGTITIGTDANISYNGFFSGPGIGTAGSFLMTLIFGTGNTVAIECDTSATLTDGGGNTITLDNIEFVVSSGNRTTFGAGDGCLGIGTSTGTYVISGSAANRTAFIGGSLNLTGGLPSDGNYSTANAGGNAISFNVIRL